MPTIKIADKPTLDQVAGEVHELLERTPFDIDSYMYYFGGLRSTHPGDDVYNWLMRTVSIVDAPGVTELGEYALYNCANLTSLSIPDCISIQKYALSKCVSLSTFNAPKVETLTTPCLALNNLKKLILPSLISLPNPYFYDNATTTTPIALEYAFLGVKNVNKTIFFNPQKIKYIMFKDLQTMSSGIFQYPLSTSAVKLILLGSAVCSLSDASIISSANLNVYVPESVYDDYIVATNWSSIADKIHKIEDSQEIIDAIYEMGVEYGA